MSVYDHLPPGPLPYYNPASVDWQEFIASLPDGATQRVGLTRWDKAALAGCALIVLTVIGAGFYR